ncbi:hypothetical protein FDG2_0189 [Candidatus Protofrankia californiensis]|uniref:Uncharacterized protein n=1 Tax=Candidatus Protofrankia californiensis TaxID=1839754 RepID=A0A1C3NT08_9ACTN|nr:hypothetical protein FDG2_0189 [Candidatus Protofrankia californiensis]
MVVQIGWMFELLKQHSAAFESYFDLPAVAQARPCLRFLCCKLDGNTVLSRYS